jgi:Xaa-Pro aminopeptidase
VRHEDRISRVADEIGTAGLAGLLVSPGPDLVYLTGYAPLPLERLTLLVVTPARAPVMLVPELERPAAIAAPLGDRIEVLGWRDGEDPYATACRLLPAGRYAITDQTWASHVLGLARACEESRFEPSSVVLPMLRAVKDTGELAALRAVGAAADAAFADVVRVRFEGRRELDVAVDLGDLLSAHGHEAVDFAIVGSGPNGASPHHEAGERVIAAGDAIVLDFGGRMAGYCSDITRTVVVGEPEPELAEVHGIVRAAQQAGVDAVHPGAPCFEIDRAARAVIADAGYGERFVHRTGHGIGLEVHEPPYIVEGMTVHLQPGMTFSVEPGVYLPGRFGVRIEDIVACTTEGVERFNEAPRDLTVVA